jgi:hypothetical protein
MPLMVPEIAYMLADGEFVRQPAPFRTIDPETAGRRHRVTVAGVVVGLSPKSHVTTSTEGRTPRQPA